MKEGKQVNELDKIGRALVDRAIHSAKIDAYPLDEQMDLVLKAGNIIKLLDWLEEHSLGDRG
jgi:hypothetical protein